LSTDQSVLHSSRRQQRHGPADSFKTAEFEKLIIQIG